VSANYTKDAKQVLSLAGDEAMIAKASTIAPVHILQGIVRSPESEAAGVLRAIGIDVDSLKAEVLEMGDASSSTMAGQDILSRAENEARSFNALQVGSDHLLAALTGETLGEVALVLMKHGITAKTVSDAISSVKAAARAVRPAPSVPAPRAAGLVAPKPVPSAVGSFARAGGESIVSNTAAEPVGAYSHARRVGSLLFLAGIGPRQRGSKEIPGVRLDSLGNVAEYNIEAQVRAAFENVRLVLEESGSSWAHIVDVTVFLTNMKRDFTTYTRLWGEYFQADQPTRTTVEVRALPTPIAFEVKVIATVA
jgi:2-aminomuconate deaminase